MGYSGLCLTLLHLLPPHTHVRMHVHVRTLSHLRLLPCPTQPSDKPFKGEPDIAGSVHLPEGLKLLVVRRQSSLSLSLSDALARGAPTACGASSVFSLPLAL
jgi:hypothetical protein